MQFSLFSSQKKSNFLQKFIPSTEDKSIYEKIITSSANKHSFFSTPKIISHLIATLIPLNNIYSIYDPCLGTGSLIFNYLEQFSLHNQLRIYGQEIVLDRLDLAIDKLKTISSNLHLSHTNCLYHPIIHNHKLLQYDLILSNPPWNQRLDLTPLRKDPHSRFPYSDLPKNSADWIYISHIASCLQPSGQAAIIIDTSALSRGSTSSYHKTELNIRKSIVSRNLISSIFLLPPHLFAFTQSPSALIIMTKSKKTDHIRFISLLEKNIDHLDLDYSSDSISIPAYLIHKNNYNLNPLIYLPSYNHNNHHNINPKNLLKKIKELHQRQSELLSQLS